MPENVFPATDWEQIDQSHQRVKVFGGWLVKAYEDVVHNTDYHGRVPGWDWRVAMTFVPDPKHEWLLLADYEVVIDKNDGEGDA